MRIIKTLLFLVPCVTMSLCYADSADDDCLKHLSGSSSMDTTCYLGSANAIQKKSQAIANKLAAAMPHGNHNAVLLKEFMSTADRNLRFCMLNKQAGSEWEPSETGPNIRNMWDVIYGECVYNRRKEQYAHLREIEELEKMNHPSQ
ncbi:hypothetical protein [Paraburkholderia hayleyella]|uniref:hypothetical protein n=1 Tax=Paraburkholderia hayleyella TaxID=2152889 RepID=UPI001290CED4|nr:hypothetical protein [Paraburkholderia hayleyella]